MKSDRIKEAKRFFRITKQIKNIEWKRIEAHIQKPFLPPKWSGMQVQQL